MISTTGVDYLTAPRATRPADALGDLQWQLSAVRPDNWSDLLRQLGGSFFHSPLASLIVPEGAQFTYATLTRGHEILGIAFGGRTQCRLSTHQRHAYFPTFPALASDVPREAALALFFLEMRRAGLYEVTFDAFDASWQPHSKVFGAPMPDRNEYVVHLDAGSCDLSVLSDQQRRQAQRGEREQWRLQADALRNGASILRSATESAAARAAARGHPFAAAIWCDMSDALQGDAATGLTVFSAHRGDTLLGGVLVGSAGNRAFYVCGGSTPQGYECGAAAWLHWRVANVLGTRGFGRYNLGGVPADAETDAAHPGHGLHRFKSGFGAEIVRRHGLRWVGEPGHMTAHRLAARVTNGFGSRGSRTTPRAELGL